MLLLNYAVKPNSRFILRLDSAWSMLRWPCVRQPHITFPLSMPPSFLPRAENATSNARKFNAILPHTTEMDFSQTVLY